MRRVLLRFWLVGGYLVGFAVVYAGARISLERFWPGVLVSLVGLGVIALTVVAYRAAGLKLGAGPSGGTRPPPG